jgi:hypothetical protein
LVRWHICMLAVCAALHQLLQSEAASHTQLPAMPSFEDESSSSCSPFGLQLVEPEPEPEPGRGGGLARGWAEGHSQLVSSFDRQLDMAESLERLAAVCQVSEVLPACLPACPRAACHYRVRACNVCMCRRRIPWQRRRPGARLPSLRAGRWPWGGSCRRWSPRTQGWIREMRRSSSPSATREWPHAATGLRGGWRRRERRWAACRRRLI